MADLKNKQQQQQKYNKVQQHEYIQTLGGMSNLTQLMRRSSYIINGQWIIIFATIQRSPNTRTHTYKYL